VIAEPEFSLAMLSARVMLSVVYLVSSIEKGINFSAALDEFNKSGLPAARVTLVATIILHFVASVCLIVGWLVPEMAIALAVFTLLATIKVHNFWTMSGQQRLERSRIALANVGLIGGLLLLAATGPGSFVL
jgi:putative oxidoreductase